MDYNENGQQTPTPAAASEQAAGQQPFGAYYGQPGTMPVPPKKAKKKREKRQSTAYTAYYTPAAETYVYPGEEAMAEKLQPQPKKKGRGGKIAAAIAIMVACMVVGCIFGVSVVAPMIYSSRFTDGLPELWEDWEEEIAKPSVKEDDYPANPQITAIGGVAPQITNTENPVPEIAAGLKNSVVGINTYRIEEEERVLYSRGTGFVIHESGYILTNYHVVADGSVYTISMDGQSEEYDARFVGGDATMDLAVLKVEKNMVPAALGSSANTMVGELAIAMGNPAGADANLTGSVTVGYISYVDRKLSYNNTQQSFLQIDTAVNPGNSGGPLLNDRGEVIGVVTLKSVVSSYDAYGQAIDSEGLGFAIPMDTAQQVALHIIQEGSVKRPGIGILFYALDAQPAAENNLPKGMLVDDFMAGSAAEEAGIEIGDVIIACDGQPIESGEAFAAKVQACQVGDILNLQVWRDGEVLEYAVVVGDMNRMVTY